MLLSLTVGNMPTGSAAQPQLLFILSVACVTRWQDFSVLGYPLTGDPSCRPSSSQRRGPASPAHRETQGVGFPWECPNGRRGFRNKCGMTLRSGSDGIRLSCLTVLSGSSKIAPGNVRLRISNQADGCPRKKDEGRKKFCRFCEKKVCHKTFKTFFLLKPNEKK